MPKLPDYLLSVQDLAKQWLIANPVIPSGGSSGLTDAQLRAAPVPITGAVTTGSLTDAQLRAAAVLISGTVNTGLTQTNPLTRAQLDSATVAGTDIFTNGQVLADQTPGGTVVTFTFSAAQQLIWVKPTGGNCRVDPFGGTPSITVGIPCDDGVPNPLTIQTTALKVFAPAGVAVAVWGYRY